MRAQNAAAEGAVAMKRSIRAVGIAAFGGAVLLATALSSTSSASSAPSKSAAPRADDARPVVRTLAKTGADQERVKRFWTKKRMRGATPMDTLLRDAGKPVSEVKRGLPKLVKPTSPKLMSFPNGGGEWTGGGAVTRTVGRVFFTFQGRTASCSGNAVTSANESVVMTAGHCVKLEGTFHTNWVFVPGYDNGNAPFGEWPASETLATAQWVASEDINHDVGAAVVGPLNGQTLVDTVGGQGLAFNQARGQAMYAFGYPAAAPYDGSTLIYCSGTVFNDFLLSQGIGMGCNMTGGSSGGPWFLRFDEGTGTGTQNSVNSFKYNFLPQFMFGPYFGNSAQDVYTRAQSG
jgi:V8-like Glu-specific endopeptidase